MRSQIVKIITRGFNECDFMRAIARDSDLVAEMDSYADFCAFQTEVVNNLSIHDLNNTVTILNMLGVACWEDEVAAPGKLEICDKQDMIPWEASSIAFSATTKKLTIFHER